MFPTAQAMFPSTQVTFPTTQEQLNLSTSPARPIDPNRSLPTTYARPRGKHNLELAHLGPPTWATYFASSLYSLYSMASTRANQLASMIFSLTPIVPHTSSWSDDSMSTRMRAAVPASLLTTRTL